MALVTGERIPDFRRLDARRKAVTLYQDFCARPVVLVGCRSRPLQPADVAALRPSKSAHDGDWQVLVLNPAHPEQLPPPDGWPPGTVCLADDGAVLNFLASSDEPFALILDRNFRLLASPPLKQLDAASVDAVYGDAEPVSAAPVLIVPGVVPPDLCDDLVAAYQGDNEASGVMRMEGGKMVYVEDPAVKIRREHRLSPGPLWQRLEERLRRCLLPEIQWAFNFRVTRFEGVKVVAYAADAGGYFSAHRDNDGEDTAHRRFALTVNLNPTQYSGGELVFPEYGGMGYRPGAGTAIVFSCNLAHEARPVTQGQRLALVSFFFSDAEQFRQAQYENRVRGS